MVFSDFICCQLVGTSVYNGVVIDFNALHYSYSKFVYMSAPPLPPHYCYELFSGLAYN